MEDAQAAFIASCVASARGGQDAGAQVGVDRLMGCSAEGPSKQAGRSSRPSAAPAASPAPSGRGVEFPPEQREGWRG
eukprot:3580185-Pyramimonas_sp.AAC.1